MTIADIVLFALASVGLTHIIVDSELFSPVRDYLREALPEKVFRVFECYQCAGTWCGFICGALLLSLDWWVILGAGFAGSFLGTWSSIYLNYMEAKSVFALDEAENGN